jgi:hypothetical protein
MRSITPPLSTPLPRAGASASTCKPQLQQLKHGRIARWTNNLEAFTSSKNTMQG